MRYILDTNICIYAIKQKPVIVFKRLLEHKPEEICISSITYSELVYGVEKSQAKERNRIALILLLSRIDIVDYDTRAAESYGCIRAELERNGTPIGSMDTMIAAHAKSLNYVLVTNNTREFERVSGLQVENWAE